MSFDPGAGFSIVNPAPVLVLGLIASALLAWLLGHFYAATPSRLHHRIRGGGRDALSLVHRADPAGVDREVLALASAQVRSRRARIRPDEIGLDPSPATLRSLDHRLTYLRWTLRWRSVDLWSVRRRLDRITEPAVRPSTSRMLADVQAALHPEDE